MFKNKCIIPAAAIIAMLTGAVTDAADLAEQPGVVKMEFIFDKAPFRQCHASTIAESKGTLTAAWFGGTAESNADVGIWLSSKEGEKWSEPKEVADGVQHD